MDYSALRCTRSQSMWTFRYPWCIKHFHGRGKNIGCIGPMTRIVAANGRGDMMSSFVWISHAFSISNVDRVHIRFSRMAFLHEPG